MLSEIERLQQVNRKQSEFIRQLMSRNRELEKELKSVKYERDILQSMNIVNTHCIDKMRKELTNK